MTFSETWSPAVTAPGGNLERDLQHFPVSFITGTDPNDPNVRVTSAKVEKQYMPDTRTRLLVAAAVLASLGCQASYAKDLRVTLPKSSHATPVQKLNREGVDAVRKLQYEKAEGLFYKAYLYDPGDPFTLNNLGYVSELQGELERAQKFYKLAAAQGGDAAIDRSNAKQLEGQPMMAALNGLKDVPMRVNRMNVEAIGMLGQDRNIEAEALLQETLKLDPKNLFTLNNLGVAEEANGDYEAAMKYYNEAAGAHSTEPVVITQKKSWRGKSVSDMAAESARLLDKKIKDEGDKQARAAMLSMRGVSAVNRNDWEAARKDFVEAYALNPESAFTLNNIGYVSERDGDPETAQAFYARAQTADDAKARVGLSTETAASGKQLVALATDSDQKIDGKLDQLRDARRRQAAPNVLRRRDNSPVEIPKTPTPETAPTDGPPADGTSTGPAAATPPGATQDSPATVPPTANPQ